MSVNDLNKTSGDFKYNAIDRTVINSVCEVDTIHLQHFNKGKQMSFVTKEHTNYCMEYKDYWKGGMNVVET